MILTEVAPFLELSLSIYIYIYIYIYIAVTTTVFPLLIIVFLIYSISYEIFECVVPTACLPKHALPLVNLIAA